jgi:hypothetical protein
MNLGLQLQSNGWATMSNARTAAGVAEQEMLQCRPHIMRAVQCFGYGADEKPDGKSGMSGGGGAAASSTATQRRPKTADQNGLRFLTDLHAMPGTCVGLVSLLLDQFDDGTLMLNCARLFANLAGHSYGQGYDDHDDGDHNGEGSGGVLLGYGRDHGDSYHDHHTVGEEEGSELAFSGTNMAMTLDATGTGTGAGMGMGMGMVASPEAIAANRLSLIDDGGVEQICRIASSRRNTQSGFEHVAIALTHCVLEDAAGVADKGAHMSGRKLVSPLIKSISSLFHTSYPLVLKCCACMLVALASCKDMCTYSKLYPTISASVMADAVPLLIQLSNTDDESVQELCMEALQQFPEDECHALITAWWDAWELEHEHPDVLFEKQVQKMWMRSTFAWDGAKAPGLTNAQLVAKARNIIARTAYKQKKRDRDQRHAAKVVQSRFRGREARKVMRLDGEKRKQLEARRRAVREKQEREAAMTKLQTRVRARQAKTRLKEQKSAATLQRIIRVNKAKKTGGEEKKLLLLEQTRKVRFGESVSLPAIV